ncbi:MAG TPA: OmpH family outer membrane protein [Candidatus Tectomicrobia bacterium]|jgi:outer membrane protein
MMGIKTQQHWKLWTWVLGGALSIGMAVSAQAQQLKVGVVDLQAVLDNSVRGKVAKDQLKDLSVKLQEEIKQKREFKDKREDELQKMRTEIRSQGLVLSEQARAAKEESFRNKARELKRFIDDTNRFIEDATQEFREKEIRETQRLLLEVRKVVQDVGAQEGYTLILEGNENAAVVLYFSKPIELTQKVIQRFDQTPATDQPVAVSPPTTGQPATKRR